jgi:hypothetical protein
MHPLLTDMGHRLADWIVAKLKLIYAWFSGNVIAFLVAAVALYVIFAPDVTGTSRI